MPNALSTTAPRCKPMPIYMQQDGVIPSIGRELTDNEKRNLKACLSERQAP